MKPWLRRERGRKEPFRPGRFILSVLIPIRPPNWVREEACGTGAKEETGMGEGIRRGKENFEKGLTGSSRLPILSRREKAEA